MLFRPSYDSNHPTYILAKSKQMFSKEFDFFFFPKLGNRELAKQLESHLPTNVNSSSFEAREYKRYTSSIGHIEERSKSTSSQLSSQPYTLKRKPEITSDRCLQSKDPFLSYNKKFFFFFFLFSFVTQNYISLFTNMKKIER